LIIFNCRNFTIFSHVDYLIECICDWIWFVHGPYSKIGDVHATVDLPESFTLKLLHEHRVLHLLLGQVVIFNLSVVFLLSFELFCLKLSL